MKIFTLRKNEKMWEFSPRKKKWKKCKNFHLANFSIFSLSSGWVGCSIVGHNISIRDLTVGAAWDNDKIKERDKIKMKIKIDINIKIKIKIQIEAMTVDAACAEEKMESWAWILSYFLVASAFKLNLIEQETKGCHLLIFLNVSGPQAGK